MRKISTGLACMLALNAHANVIQYFAGISYANPADLFRVKDYSLILGGTGSYANLEFRGSALNFNTFQYETGVGHSRTYTVLPYGRIAKRINEDSVFSIDVTQPFNSNLNWGNDAFTRYAVTQNYLTDVNVSPKISYSLTQRVKVGAGLDFNFLTNNEVNWAFPTGATTYANLINKTSSFGLGFDVGGSFLIDQTNFLGLTYYSRIRQNTTGYSVLASNYSNNLMFNFSMPATTVLSYVHIFNPTWLLSLQGFQSEWNVNQQARLYNTAAPAPFSNFVFDTHFRKSYAFVAAVRNQFAEKLGLTFAGMVDIGPERDAFRTLTFPSANQYFLGLVGDYHVNAKTTIELLYGQVFSNPSIGNSVVANNQRIPFTTGNVDINANVLDLKIKIEA